MKLTKAQLHEIQRFVEDYEVDEVVLSKRTRDAAEISARITLPQGGGKLKATFDLEGNDLDEDKE